MYLFESACIMNNFPLLPPSVSIVAFTWCRV